MIQGRIQPDWTSPLYLVESTGRPVDRYLQAETGLLLAMSGGQDSMALFSLLLQEKKQRRCKVTLCWCNHLWHCDTFYAMHHLMRLSSILEEAISFLLEPTSNPPPPERRGEYWERGSSKVIASSSPLVKRYDSDGEVDRKVDQRKRQRQSYRESDKHRQGEKSLLIFYARLLLQEHRRPSLPQGGSSKRQEKRSTTEEAARNWRYQSCHRLATFHTCRVIKVGHTASDAVETSFFNLLRGSGIKGVTAIQRTRIVRPLYPKHFPLSNFYGVTRNTFK